MVQMVDSREQELSPEDIVAIDAMNMESGLSRDQAIALINAELKMDDSLFIRQGNTLYVMHKAEPGVAYFQAFNADIPENFLQNNIEFAKACYKMGFDTVATILEEPSTASFYRGVVEAAPNPDMGYELQEMEDGSYMAVIKTGPDTGGANELL